MKKRLALITWSGLPDGAESERLMLPHLAAASVETEIVDWRSSSHDFSKFDLIVLRSCWDYHLRAAEFIDWLQRVGKVTPVLDATNTVLWNHNKFYLREVEALGIEIAPTIFATDNAAIGADLGTIRSWKKIVVKPAISASAHNTCLMDGSAFSAEHELVRAMAGQPFLVQQFIPQIQEQGEKSFVYVDGRFSHAVRRDPVLGSALTDDERRLLPACGLGVRACEATSAELALAKMVLDAVPAQFKPLLYARIDTVPAADGAPQLMELEITEPELFLRLDAHAPARYARAMQASLAARAALVH